MQFDFFPSRTLTLYLAKLFVVRILAVLVMLVLVLLIGNEAFIIWVGDSRIYLLREGMLEQITEDHTVYNELVKRKKLPREQVEKLAPKNAITRCVGSCLASNARSGLRSMRSMTSCESWSSFARR